MHVDMERGQDPPGMPKVVAVELRRPPRDDDGTFDEPPLGWRENIADDDVIQP